MSIVLATMRLLFFKIYTRGIYRARVTDTLQAHTRNGSRSGFPYY